MRRLVSAIHPQLPLDARQTAQLLASLTTSFQRHLDKAHPVVQASRQPASNKPTTSLTEARNHFDTIITHPSFAGLQHKANPNADVLEKRAIAALRMAEEKLKRGTFNVFEATSLFKTMHSAAMASAPRTDMSFGSRFLALLRSSGQGPVTQFFSITGMGSKWTALMFHEGREAEVLRLIRDLNPSTWLLAHYISTGLRVKGLDFFVGELKKIDQLSAAGQFPPDQSAFTSCMVFLAHTILRSQSNLDMFGRSDYQTLLNKHLSNSIFQTKAPDQMAIALATADLLHKYNPDATQILRFIKTLEQNTSDLDYWTTNQFRRRMLLEISLKAAKLLCLQEKYTDAQYLLQFAEVAFSEELESPDKATETHNVQQKRRRASMKEEQAVLSRLDGLLPS
jgi:hypothetical protein